MSAPPPGPGPAYQARLAAFWDGAVMARVRIVKILPLAGAPLVASMTAVNFLLGALPIVFMVVTSEMIGGVPRTVADGLGSASWNRLVQLFVLAAAAFTAQQILGPIQATLGLRIQRKVDGLVRDQAVAAVTCSVGIAPLEDAEVLGKLSGVRMAFENNWFTPGHAAAGLLYLVARYVQVMALISIVGWLIGARIAVGMLAVFLMLRMANRGGLRRYSAIWRIIGGVRRRLVYLRDLTIGPVAAKEIRVFGSMDWLSERCRETYHAFSDPIDAERRRIYFKPYLFYAPVALAFAAWGLTTLAGRAAGGELASGMMSLRDLTLGLQALMGAMLLSRDFPESDTSTQFGMNALTALREVAVTIEQGDQAPGGTVDVPVSAPSRSIEFRDLHFRYPGAHAWVFSGLDLSLEAGKTTAIVGVNGAGKTTLIKLLARLYDPFSGAILVDGLPLTELDVRQWRQTLSVVFQDFVRYEMSAGDNIAAGAAFVPYDREAVEVAARRAGMLDILAGASRGLDTILARGYAGGTDLSGGQWQRVAIARSLYALAKGARVLVLDEPTAALDVRAEAAFFDQFLDLTRGATSLLISHRFSSVRRAHRIVVIERGAVIEAGTHDELISDDTRYRRLFELQARRFREGLDVAGDEDDS